MVDPNEVNLKELEDFESGGTQEMNKENGVQFFLIFFNTFFFFFFLPQHVAWGILVPRPGINLMPLQWKLGVLTTELPRKSPEVQLFLKQGLT